MKIGLLYEGDYDQEPFSILLKRIIRGIDHGDTASIIPYAASGSILSKVESALKLFFEVDKPCDSSVFINDLDNKEERCKRIKSMVLNYKQKHPNTNILVLCQNPTFETWFFDEENALKKTLGLPMEDPIPYQDMHPKTRLEKLIYEHVEDYTKSKMDIYREIAGNLNIQSLYMRNSEFKKLYIEFIK